MRPATRLTLTVLLLAVALLGATTATPWQLDPPHLTTPVLEPPQAPQPAATATPGQDSPPDDTDGTPWIALVLGAVVAALLLVGAARLVRHLAGLVRERTDTHPDTLPPGTATTTPGDEVHLPDLQDAVTRALTHLDHHTRPRDAVVAAWVALEDAAARAGTRRDPAQTPTEFTTAVLATTPAPPDAVTRLRTLYQRARFTDRPVDDHAVDQARTALAAIARSLDVPDAGAVEAP
ncbi:hypothetical protein GCM10010102_24890 [Promicromonospora citrea]|uniref:Protein-glutamine gamma-glutamyltransferase-like C-terminal domain-containing protein n=2 Tax=Promicromonospora citrea TaxID=43677 RepID=A0A8H9GKW4_9MICO|nr:DUF4129 domain-containing protein [Promicromonospora citrea]GGM28138.1 hypothetical protein GCM10010102_24890 [Promicromonospora citrea]